MVFTWFSEQTPPLKSALAILRLLVAVLTPKTQYFTLLISMKVMLALQLRNKDGLPQLEYQLKHKNTGIWTKTNVMMMKRIREGD